MQSNIISMGSVLPMLVRFGDTEYIVAGSGAGPWPRSVTSGLVAKHHGGESPLGILRTVVPAAVGAWLVVLERFNTRSYSELAASFVEITRNSFFTYALMAERMEGWEHRFRAWKSSAGILLQNGRVLRIGELSVQPERSASLKHLCDEDGAVGLGAAQRTFYECDIAAKIPAFQRE